MKEKELLFVSVDGFGLKIYKIMNFIKNVLFVTYIQNKGLRRLALVISCVTVIYCLCGILSNIRPIDKIYKNLEDMQTDIRIFYEAQTPYWYEKQDCAAIYLEKYGLDSMSAVSFLVSKSYTEYCELYLKECQILSAIKDEPIHLKCRGWGNERRSAFGSICILALFFIGIFYLPFIFLCLAKICFLMLRWILRGFRES